MSGRANTHGHECMPMAPADQGQVAAHGHEYMLMAPGVRGGRAGAGAGEFIGFAGRSMISRV